VDLIIGFLTTWIYVLMFFVALVGYFASALKNRSFLGWAFIAFFTTPVIAAIILIIVPSLPDPKVLQTQNRRIRFSKKSIIKHVQNAS